MACPDTQIFLGFFSTASPEWLRTCPEGMSGDSGHLADPPELPCRAQCYSSFKLVGNQFDVTLGSGRHPIGPVAPLP